MPCIPRIPLLAYTPRGWGDDAHIKSRIRLAGRMNGVEHPVCPADRTTALRAHSLKAVRSITRRSLPSCSDKRTPCPEKANSPVSAEIVT